MPFRAYLITACLLGGKFDQIKPGRRKKKRPAGGIPAGLFGDGNGLAEHFHLVHAENRVVAQLFLDAEELVVFRDSV